MKFKAYHILLFFALLFATEASAQVDRRVGPNQYRRTTNKNKKGEKPDFVQITVDYYTKELKLDDFQKAAVRTIMEEQREPINDLMETQGITNDERRDRGKAINDRIDEKIKPVLSSEQLKKYTEIQEKRKF